VLQYSDKGKFLTELEPESFLDNAVTHPVLVANEAVAESHEVAPLNAAFATDSGLVTPNKWISLFGKNDLTRAVILTINSESEALSLIDPIAITS
jgi:hypothetical protein